MSADELLALAHRCQVRDEKLRRLIGSTNMSVEGQAIAISMIVTLDLDIFRDCARALRASAASEPTARLPATTAHEAGGVVTGESE